MKEILLSGVLGGFVMFMWITVSSSIIPIGGDLAKEIPNDKDIHTMLKNKIPGSGIYWLPGHAGQQEGLYPDYDNEPIFHIFYAGATPSTTITQTIVEILCIFLTPVIAAWILSKASEKILAKYARRAVFVMSIGLLFAVYGDLFSQKPLDLILLSSVNNIVMWALVGLVLAWRIKPKGGKALSALAHS